MCLNEILSLIRLWWSLINKIKREVSGFGTSHLMGRWAHVYCDDQFIKQIFVSDYPWRITKPSWVCWKFCINIIQWLSVMHCFQGHITFFCVSSSDSFVNRRYFMPKECLELSWGWRLCGVIRCWMWRIILLCTPKWARALHGIGVWEKKDRSSYLVDHRNHVHQSNELFKTTDIKSCHTTASAHFSWL